MHSIFIGCFIAAVVIGGGTYIWKHRDEHREKVGKVHRFLELLTRMAKRASRDFQEYIGHLRQVAEPEKDGTYDGFLSLFRRKPRFVVNDPLKDYIDLKVNREEAKRFLARMSKESPEIKELAERLAQLFLSESAEGEERRGD